MLQAHFKKFLCRQLSVVIAKDQIMFKDESVKSTSLTVMGFRFLSAFHPARI